MLKEHNKVTLKDSSGKNDIIVEINIPGKEDKLKFKLRDLESWVSKEELYSLVFVMADPEMQEKLMPVRSVTITKYRKQHRVIAKKDIKRGDKIIVNCEINVPTIIEEGIKSMIGKRSRGIIPVSIS